MVRRRVDVLPGARLPGAMLVALSLVGCGAPAREAEPIERPVASAATPPPAPAGPDPGARVALSYVRGCVVREGRASCWGFGPGGVGDDVEARPQVIPGVDGAVAVGLGIDSACVLDRAGAVRCWGTPMVAGADPAAWAKPPGVTILTDAVSLDMGTYHACAIDRERRVRCWGNNSLGEIDVGRVRDLALGDDFGCALTEPGSVRCWGSWQDRDRATGAFSIADVEPLRGATAIAAGRRHVCGILEGGRVVCRERKSGSPDGEATPMGPQVGDREVTGAVEIDAGYGHTCARLVDGRVTCWGSWAHGAGPRQEQRQPFDVPGLAAVDTIATGSDLSCALRGGEVWCWGDPRDALFAPGSSHNPGRPTPVKGIDDATDVASSHQLACAIRRDVVWCWGDKAPVEHEQSGQRFVPESTGIQATAISGASIFPGRGSSVALLDDSGLRIAATTDRPAGVGVRGFPGKWRSVALAGGWCAAAANGKVTCDGKVVALPLPAEEVVAYERDRCARSADGRVACWGHLCTTDEQKPRLVKGVQGVKQIALGSSGAVARTDEGVFAITFCDGDRVSRMATPRPVRALAAVGSRCMIADDGQVLCHRGPLAPLAPIGIGDAEKVVESSGVICALQRGGKVTCLGNGSDGVLGNGQPSLGPWRVEGL